MNSNRVLLSDSIGSTPNYTMIDEGTQIEIELIQEELQRELERLRIKYSLNDKLATAFSWVTIAYLVMIFVLCILSDLHKFFCMGESKKFNKWRSSSDQVDKGINDEDKKEKHEPKKPKIKSNKIEPVDENGKKVEVYLSTSFLSKINEFEKKREYLHKSHSKLMSKSKDNSFA